MTISERGGRFAAAAGKTIAVALMAGIGLAGTASAATINVGSVGTLTCFVAGTTTSGCQGFVGSPTDLGMTGLPGPGTLSGSTASLFDFRPANETRQTDILNALAGTSFTKDDADRTEKGGVASADFSVFSYYFIIKLGAGTAVFANTAGQLLDVTYTKNSGSSGSAGGLSHVTEVAPIPLPAAGWLLVGGLAGLGAVARRRKAATA